MKKILISLSLGVFALCIALPASASLSFPSVADLDHGDLIKTASSSSVYYFGDNEMRYGFPNEATYYTWYDNFNGVKTISVSQMGDIPFGGNVTYKPQMGNDGISTRLLKLSGKSTVYVPIGDGMLVGLKGEDNASALFGLGWKNYIDTLPDVLANQYTFLSGYLADSTRFIEDNGYSISDDKELQTTSGVMMYEDPMRFAGYDELGTCKTTGTCCTGNYCGYNVVKVDEGGTAKFINYTEDSLTIREEDGLWTTGKMEPGDIVVLQINLDSGVYNFQASENHSMVGVMVVE
ncbi:MAG: hypothetical protein ABIA83_00295 [Patescibacteria group bacterium]